MKKNNYTLLFIELVIICLAVSLSVLFVELTGEDHTALLLIILAILIKDAISSEVKEIRRAAEREEKFQEFLEKYRKEWEKR